MAKAFSAGFHRIVHRAWPGHNVIATPGAAEVLAAGPHWGHLSAVLIIGTLPGVFAGAVICVELLPGVMCSICSLRPS